MEHKLYIKCDEACQRKVGVSVIALMAILSVVVLLLVLIGIA